MTIKTNYFDGTSYSAIDAVAPWAALLTDGIFGTSSGDLNVLAHSPANLSVDIQTGQGFKNGYFFNSDSIVNVPIAANTSGYNRIDLIVANVDITNKVTTFTTVQGTPSSSPTAPLPTVNQLVLAQAYVGNNVSVINQSNVTDLRQNVDLFGNQVAGKADNTQVGRYPAFTWIGTIKNCTTVYIGHNLGYRPIVTFSGSEGNLELTYQYDTLATLSVSCYSSGNNDWKGTIYMW